MPIIGGGGGKFFFEGWTFCWGVIANIGGGGEAPPENPSMVICYLVCCQTGRHFKLSRRDVILAIPP